MNQNERYVGLINTDDKNSSHKKYMKDLFKERFDEMIELMKQILMIWYITSKAIVAGKDLANLKMR